MDLNKKKGGSIVRCVVQHVGSGMLGMLGDFVLRHMICKPIWYSRKLEELVSDYDSTQTF